MLATLLCAGAARNTAIAAGPGITVLVYNYAAVPAVTLERVEDEAARIFRHAGIETAWRDCRAEARETNLPCPAPAIFTPGLRIVPNLQLVRNAVRADTMGYSVGYFATISVDSADILSRRGLGEVEGILGHLAAHELGHVLLPGTAHTVTGIMKARWNRDDWNTARLGWVFFARKQSEFMRRELLAGPRLAALGGETCTAQPANSGRNRNDSRESAIFLRREQQ